MVQLHTIRYLVALLLAECLPLALGHGHDEDKTEVMRMSTGTAHAPSAMSSASMARLNSSYSPESYFGYSEFGGLMLAHIAVMTAAWFFVLPIGVMLSIARDRLALAVQLSFLGLHSIGLLLGTVYTYNTPQLYESNAHNKFGWLITCVVVLQCVMGVVKLMTGIGKSHDRPEERSASPQSASQIHEQDERSQHQYPSDSCEIPRDSGHLTAYEPSRSHSISSTDTYTQEEEQNIHQHDAYHFDHGNCEHWEKRGLLVNGKVERLTSKLSTGFTWQTMRVIDAAYNLVDRTILLMGFVAFMTGAAVYGGVFRGNDIFNGLAHTVKGGIFFWYGLLTLGRWMGCFVEYGWAWNVRPPTVIVGARKARIPSAEFVESFVIFLYGSTNIFLEHLAAWGKAWSPMDLEHLSITIMFIGGGLCGMLVESTRVRDLLNAVMLIEPATRGPSSMREKLAPPRTYSIPMNPFPGLVILLLGLMMSSHHQHSMISSAIHKQWGTLLVGFALARAVTYILAYVSPPSSYLPSRPPSELISAFCLISGGIIFMASNRNTVNALEYYGIHAMFPFTVTMGLTAFIMAWSIIVLAVKGWAIGRNQSSAPLRSDMADS